MPQPNERDRATWRESHADLVTFIDTYDGTNRFIRSLRGSMQNYGSLTPAQTTAALRVMQEMAQATGEPVVVAEQQPVAMTSEAGENDCTNIFNGDYTINNGTEHLTYRIHTVRRGPLAGKRIIKIQQQYGEFSGFAFLTVDGRVKVWRRLAEDERRNEKYIVWASILMNALREEQPEGEMISSWSADGVRWQVQATTRCRRCNRELTTPSSIDAGLGPECAQRSNDRTTAADRHQTVADFQSTHPMQADGIVGPNTRSLLDSVRAELPEEGYFIGLGTTGDQVGEHTYDIDTGMNHIITRAGTYLLNNVTVHVPANTQFPFMVTGTDTGISYTGNDGTVIALQGGDTWGVNRPYSNQQEGLPPVQEPYPTELQLVQARLRDRNNYRQGRLERFNNPEFTAVYNRLNYTDRIRTCQDCGRMFRSRMGVARHRGTCEGVREDRHILNQQRASAQAQQTPQPTPRMRRVPRTPTSTTPNLSALGTRFGGEVWPQ